jgi:hypothetical protein
MGKVLLGFENRAGSIFFTFSQCFWMALTLQNLKLGGNLEFSYILPTSRKETPILSWNEVEAYIVPGQYGPRYGNELVIAINDRWFARFHGTAVIFWDIVQTGAVWFFISANCPAQANRKFPVQLYVKIQILFEPPFWICKWARLTQKIYYFVKLLLLDTALFE